MLENVDKNKANGEILALKAEIAAISKGIIPKGVDPETIPEYVEATVRRIQLLSKPCSTL